MKRILLILLVVILLLCLKACYSNKNENGISETTNSKILKELDSYLADIESQTHLQIPKNQKDLIIAFLQTDTVYRLDTNATKAHRADFDKKKKSLLKEWSQNLGDKWPTYKKDVLLNRKAVRMKGQNYDAHHIIELSFNGANKWWNLTPAAYPNEHQEGIHRKGGISAQLFGEIPDYVN